MLYFAASCISLAALSHEEAARYEQQPNGRLKNEAPELRLTQQGILRATSVKKNVIRMFSSRTCGTLLAVC
jgi:hypothetical protein